jgi:hypothetical protein
MKSVSMWYQKKPIPQLSIFCLIQGINYVQMNIYWRYTVGIMASNILLLASKFFFSTSQGLVGAGMNCRALPWCVYLTVFNIYFRRISPMVCKCESV